MTDYTRHLVFKPGLAASVLRGEKTVTRRLAREEETRPRWREGALAKVYAQQPYRGGVVLADVHVLACALEPLDAVTDAETAPEGLAHLDRAGFVALFLSMYGLNTSSAAVNVWRVSFEVRRVYAPGRAFLKRLHVRTGAQGGLDFQAGKRS